MLPTKFGVNWLLDLGEEKKNRFSRYLGFPNGTTFAIFIYKLPRCFLPSLESTGFSVQKKKQKIDFHDGGYGGHLGYPIVMSLATFNR